MHRKKLEGLAGQVYVATHCSDSIFTELMSNTVLYKAGVL